MIDAKMSRARCFGLYVFIVCCFVSLIAFAGNANSDKNENTNISASGYKIGEIVSNSYIRNPEKFVHINKDCKLCMIARPANSGCVVAKDGKILLVRDKYSKKLGLPGGLKSKMETATMTAFRRTFEETGLIVYIDDFVSEFKNGFRLYKCKVIKDTGKVEKDIVELKYVDKEELGEILKKVNRKDARFPHELDLVYSKFEWVNR